ncbi:MAG TPA: pyridoxal phosphate-dependent aminotransferase [Candidatus Sulfotelmatobacter sp.]|nr:pyridoxal phosphate-dependent aminotransferase [Candidatus Sulfotelmatobacter sp.]
MSPQRREIRSAYLEWAKLRSPARFQLAPSDVLHFPLAELRVRIEDLEISGPGGYGYAPLQQRLAAKAGVAPENVVPAQGTSLANHLAMAALIEPEDEVLIEEPAYEALLALALYLGARIRRFPRSFEAGFQIDPREVERAISPRTRLVVLTNLHNPSGVRTPDSTLKLVGEIARSLGAHVLVDEVYLEACFDSPWQSAFHLGSNFVATSSLTKAYGLSGLRCGWVLAAPKLAERMWRINDLFGVNAAHPAELLSVIALDHLPKIAARARALLAANRALLKNFFDARKDLLAIWPEAGTVAFPLLTSGHAEAFCQLLRDKYETSVVPGHFFEAPDHFRIGVGGETENVREGLTRIAAALDELGSKR